MSSHHVLSTLVVLLGVSIAPARAQQTAPALTPNPLIEQLQKAAPDGERLVELIGYVGSSTPETVRLYISLSLAIYLEIPRSAIVNVLQEGNPSTGPVRLFVRGSAPIIVKVRLNSGTNPSSQQASPTTESDPSAARESLKYWPDRTIPLGQTVSTTTNDGRTLTCIGGSPNGPKRKCRWN